MNYLASNILLHYLAKLECSTVELFMCISQDEVSLRDTSVPSTLEMLHDNALYKFNIDVDIDMIYTYDDNFVLKW